MNKEELEKQILLIDEEMEDINYEGRTAIKDGIVNVDEYLNADLKIMWILKEVNSSDDEDWDLREVLSNLKDENGRKIKEGWAGTFNPIIYITYGILNNQYWQEIPNSNVKPEIIDVLRKIAFVNVKKVSGDSIAVKSKLIDFHKNYGHILKMQIDSFSPDVIICGNTLEIFDDFGNEYEKREENGMIFYTSPKHIIIDAFHPNNRKMKQEAYCDTIIEGVSQWRQKQSQ